MLHQISGINAAEVSMVFLYDAGTSLALIVLLLLLGWISLPRWGRILRLLFTWASALMAYAYLESLGVLHYYSHSPFLSSSASAAYGMARVACVVFTFLVTLRVRKDATRQARLLMGPFPFALVIAATFLGICYMRSDHFHQNSLGGMGYTVLASFGWLAVGIVVLCYMGALAAEAADWRSKS